MLLRSSMRGGWRRVSVSGITRYRTEGCAAHRFCRKSNERSAACTRSDSTMILTEDACQSLYLITDASA